MPIVCTLRDFPGASDFETPAPAWGMGERVACARNAAVSDDQAVATMDPKYLYSYSGKLTTRADRVWNALRGIFE